MKILHTSDWHLGHVFYGKDRKDEFDDFFSQIDTILEKERPQAMMISGDIFDSSTPSNAAAKQYYQEIAHLYQKFPEMQIFIVAGNHDSPTYLVAPKDLLEAFNTTLVCSIEKDAQGNILWNKLIHPILENPSKTGSKPIGWVLTVPHIRRGELRSFAPDAEDSEAVVSFYHELAKKIPSGNSEGLPVIAMGHLATSGCVFAKENIGGLDNIPAAAFAEGISYTALGHIHKEQTVDADGRARYCGSPLPITFSEKEYKNSVTVVEFEGSEVTDTRLLEINRPVQLLTIPQNKSNLKTALDELRTLPAETKAFVQLNLENSTDAYVTDFKQQVNDAIAGKPGVVFCRTVPLDATVSSSSGKSYEPANLDDFRKKDPLEVMKELYSWEHNQEMSDEQIRMISEIINEVTKTK